ncbi:hypothetical protein CspeluHIS016_0902790 [Cutaneotrichosporon spelunceum]|uniref:Uncharacterized protein n=1 Tax=Cutaneotrichosporon spelunceum TaxID=1672016 RepID=A0AAD3U086_9TREE|nr:hypothetical protein CspeluHIS016_0902790 [Cutaneotrichosporon spelunceum]
MTGVKGWLAHHHPSASAQTSGPTSAPPSVHLTMETATSPSPPPELGGPPTTPAQTRHRRWSWRHHHSTPSDPTAPPAPPPVPTTPATLQAGPRTPTRSSTLPALDLSSHTPFLLHPASASATSPLLAPITTGSWLTLPSLTSPLPSSINPSLSSPIPGVPPTRRRRAPSITRTRSRPLHPTGQTRFKLTRPTFRFFKNIRPALVPHPAAPKARWERYRQKEREDKEREDKEREEKERGRQRERGRERREERAKKDKSGKGRPKEKEREQGKDMPGTVSDTAECELEAKDKDRRLFSKALRRRSRASPTRSTSPTSLPASPPILAAGTERRISHSVLPRWRTRSRTVSPNPIPTRSMSLPVAHLASASSTISTTSSPSTSQYALPITRPRPVPPPHPATSPKSADAPDRAHQVGPSDRNAGGGSRTRGAQGALASVDAHRPRRPAGVPARPLALACGRGGHVGYAGYRARYAVSPPSG